MINYVEKEYPEIFMELLEDSFNSNLISHDDKFLDYIKNREDISNFYVMLLAVISDYFSKVYDDATLIYNDLDIDKASSSGLDVMGKLINCPRPPATRSSVVATFTLSRVLETDVSINAGGITLLSDNNVAFVTVEELYIPAGTISCSVQCMSESAGVSTHIIENSLNKIVNNLDIPSSISVTNLEASSGGVDAYSDEQYISLLKNWIISQEKGTEQAFVKYFSSLDGIDGYKLIPNWDGSGTIKIVLDPGTPYILNNVYADLRNSVDRFDSDIFLTDTIKKNIDVYATANIDIDQINPYSSSEKDLVMEKIITATKLFIDGGYRTDGTYYKGLSIGEDFIPHKLAVFLDKEVSELKNIKFTFPEDYILIADEEQGKSNIIEIIME